MAEHAAVSEYSENWSEPDESIAVEDIKIDSLRSNNYSAAISPSKNTGCFSARIVPVGDITERRGSILGGID